MMSQSNLRLLLAPALLIAVWSVLSFPYGSTAAPPEKREPFGNSVRQRSAMIQELKEIKMLLKEQNKLLRAAFLKTRNNERRPR